ncbi:MAG: filamentous hemagglutinin N-terminal domain-containing protein, partial [Endomicrobium sp.]|nr:filamentous hemagglutinin N-terminal domain-containing protein [Endomicrobium sp.]
MKKTLSVVISVCMIFGSIVGFGGSASGASPELGENSSSGNNENHPLNNIKDRPVSWIEADNKAGRGEIEIDRAQNGTPIININRAGEGGVSANYYKEFNVNQEHVILNNYKGEAVNTKLGGTIYGNPNYNKEGAREADIILNEVTGNNRTNIDGYIEVGGKKADLVIANANGITVGGAGFINVGRMSLITGRSA